MEVFSLMKLLDGIRENPLCCLSCQKPSSRKGNKRALRIETYKQEVKDELNRLKYRCNT